MIVNKVLYNIDQRADTSDAEKKTARDNIGALGALNAGDHISIVNDTISVTGVQNTLIPGNNISIVNDTISVTGVDPYTFSTGLTKNGNTISVTNPLPDIDTSTDIGKILKATNQGAKWQPAANNLKSSNIGQHTITADDITNGYFDIPRYFWDSNNTQSLDALTWFLLIEDAGYIRGSLTSSLVSYATKIKISWCDDNNTWESYDNAHGSDPEGQLFEDIPASDLARIGGYPTLVHKIRKIGGDPTSAVQIRGPSFRVMLESSGPQVGDIVTISGAIQCIHW